MKKTEDNYSGAFSADVLRFIDQRFMSARSEGELPVVQGKHEAYGIMAEKFVAVSAFVSELNRTMKDALAALPDSDEPFVAACEQAYNNCINAAMAAIDMATHMQNIVTQIALYNGQSAGVTPLEAMAGDGEDAPELIPEESEH